MKRTLSILLALVFLFSLGVLPVSVQAAAQPASMAYLSLISPKSDASLPVEIEARSAYTRLLPRLAEAQARGQIMAFKPEYAFGLVKVQVSSGTDLAAVLRLGGGADVAVFTTPGAALEYSQVGERMQNASVGGGSPYIEINPYESCFYAYYMGANNFFMAYLVDTTGREVSSAHGYANGSGYIDGCFNGIWGGIDPGFHFTLNVYNNAATTLLATYPTTVQNMTFSAISVSSKTLKGKGPASTVLTTELNHRNLDAGNDWTSTIKAVTTASNGSWSVNFAPAAMFGTDYVDVYWSDGGYFDYEYAAEVPAVFVTEGYNYFVAFGLPGQKASFSIKHGGASVKLSGGTIAGWGYFSGYLWDKTGAPLFPVAGDRVSATSVKTYILPTITSLADYTNNAVIGSAPPNTYFEVDLDLYSYATKNWNDVAVWTHSNAAGYYSADFSSWFDIVPGNRFETYVYFYDPATGNETSYTTYVEP